MYIHTHISWVPSCKELAHGYQNHSHMLLPNSHPRSYYPRTQRILLCPRMIVISFVLRFVDTTRTLSRTHEQQRALFTQTLLVSLAFPYTRANVPC